MISWVPRSRYDDVVADRDQWRAAYHSLVNAVLVAKQPLDAPPLVPMEADPVLPDQAEVLIELMYGRGTPMAKRVRAAAAKALSQGMGHDDLMEYIEKGERVPV